MAGPVCTMPESALHSDFARMSLSQNGHHYAAEPQPNLGCATEARHAGSYGQPSAQNAGQTVSPPGWPRVDVNSWPPAQISTMPLQDHASEQHPQVYQPTGMSGVPTFNATGNQGHGAPPAEDESREMLMSDEFDEELSYMANQVHISDGHTPAQAMHYIF